MFQSIFILVARPVAAQQSAIIKIDDVRFETETDVRLDAAALKLLIAGKGEDVVPKCVRGAIMLMKTAVRGSINHITGDQNTAAAFIQINSPTAIPRRADIVPEIVDNLCPGLHAECVNAAHIAENGSITVRLNSNVMDMIKGDYIVGRD